MKKCILLFALVAYDISMQAHYSLKLLTSSELQEIVPFMVEQRIAAFRDYPYLYEGNTKEENEYCQWFVRQSHSAVAVAYWNGQPAGFVSGTSFTDFDIHFKASIDLFENNGLDPKKFYYIPEVIIMPEHRKKGLARKLLNLIEQHAQKLGYQSSCLVHETHEHHPLKPINYQTSENIWLKHGYWKTGMIIKFPWLTLQPDSSLKNEDHELRYWIKNLS